MFKKVKGKIATNNYTIGKNLNAFNVRVVDSNYKHVKVLYNGTWL